MASLHKEGWLFKLSGYMFRSWEYRWVILQDHFLSYFIHKHEHQPKKTFGSKNKKESFLLVI